MVVIGLVMPPQSQQVSCSELILKISMRSNKTREERLTVDKGKMGGVPGLYLYLSYRIEFLSTRRGHHRFFCYFTQCRVSAMQDRLERNKDVF